MRAMTLLALSLIGCSRGPAPVEPGVDRLGECTVRLLAPPPGARMTRLRDVRPDLPGIQVPVMFEASPGCKGHEVTVGVQGGEFVRYPEIVTTGPLTVPDLTIVTTDHEPSHPVDLYVRLTRPPQSI
jgi:hypothetical protein